MSEKLRWGIPATGRIAGVFANVPHAVEAEQQLKMLLVMVKR